MRLQHRMLLLLALTCATLIGGCYDNVDTPFPSGLEPWETNMLPARAAGAACTQTLSFARTDYMGTASVHSRGCLQGPLLAAFEAIRHPCAGADRRPQVDFCYRVNTEPEYDYSHRSDFKVHGEIVPVDIQITWRHGVIEGTPAAPRVTSTRWQKTAGFSGISVLEGSLIARQSPDGNTDIDLQYHLNAVLSGHDTIEAYLTGYWESILALIAGQPLPLHGGASSGQCAAPPQPCPLGQVDAGQSDAGPAVDAGPPSDGGASDAGSASDAGGPMDGGVPDAG